MHLGNLRGTGTLEWNDNRVRVAYDIDVSYYRNMLEGSGSFGHSQPIPGIFDADRVVLRIQSGEEVRVHIENVGSGQGSFLTSGVIPGGWENRVPH